MNQISLDRLMIILIILNQIKQLMDSYLNSSNDDEITNKISITSHLIF